MRYINVENGVVTEVRVTNTRRIDGWIAHETAKVGDLYADGILTPVIPVPQEVTRRQARQALLLAGLLSDVQPAIDAIPDATQRALIQIEWEDSQVFERHRPALLLMAGALGLDGAALDQLFITAGAL